MILIIGYGNPLRGDDGIGWHATRMLAMANRADVEIRAVHQLTPDLAEPLSRARLAIFIDAEQQPAIAANSPPPPKSHRVVPTYQNHLPSFSHHLTPGDLLVYCEVLWQCCPDAWLYTVPGYHFDVSDTLSPMIQAALPDLIAQISELLTSYQGTGAPTHPYLQEDMLCKRSPIS